MTEIKPDTLEQTIKRQYEEWKERILNDENLYVDTLEMFEKYLDDLDNEDTESLLEIVNIYRENQGLEEIHYNEDHILDEYLKSPSKAIKEVNEGDFDYYDGYVSFNPLTSYSNIPYLFELRDIFLDIIDFPDKYDVDLRIMTEDAR